MIKALSLAVAAFMLLGVGPTEAKSKKAKSKKPKTVPKAPSKLAAKLGFIGHLDEKHGWDISAMDTLIPSPVGFHTATLLVGFPILPGGTVGVTKGVNDAVYLDLDLTAGMFPSPNPFTEGTIITNILVGLRYQFFLFRWFAAYAWGRLGVTMTKGDLPQIPWAYAFMASGGLGMLFTVHKHIGFRFETGWPPVRLGIVAMF